MEDMKKLLEEMNKNMSNGFSGIRNDIDSLKRNDIEPLKNEVKEMNDTVKASLQATNNRIDDLEIQLKEKNDEIKSLKKLCETQKRQNNIVLFNLPETEKSVQELAVVVVLPILCLRSERRLQNWKKRR